jgi:hypothetical protein
MPPVTGLSISCNSFSEYRLPHRYSPIFYSLRSFFFGSFLIPEKGLLWKAGNIFCLTAYILIG